QQPFPTALRTQASPHLNSEEVLSYEIGYRTTFLNNISIDFTAFYNNYSQLRAAIINTPVFKKNHIEVPMSLVNKHKLQTYGFEISSVWQLFDWWRMDAHYRLLKTSYTKNHLGGVYSVSPQQQVLLRNSASLGHGINIDIITRYTDENFPFTTNSLNKTSVNDYFAMDVRLAWQATNGIELSLIGQNLLATQQLEYTSELFSADAFVERGVYGKIVWEF
ncbi:MAG: TonB-dependent receptor, partial [Methylococcales bacterium]|nr:TonB-dependent receptor [Methylococcales bacterium]